MCAELELVLECASSASNSFVIGCVVRPPQTILMNEYVEHFPFFVVHAPAFCFESLSCDAIPLNSLVFFRRSIDGNDYEGAESVASERKERIFFCHFHGEQTVTR